MTNRQTIRAPFVTMACVLCVAWRCCLITVDEKKAAAEKSCGCCCSARCNNRHQRRGGSQRCRDDTELSAESGGSRVQHNPRAEWGLSVDAVRCQADQEGDCLQQGYYYYYFFKAHQHKAAGRKTRLDIQNYGCNSYLIYYHSVIIIIINEYYYSAMESKKTSRSLNNRKNKTSDSVMRDNNRSKACQRSNEQLKSSVFSRRLKAMTRCAMEWTLLEYSAVIGAVFATRV